MENPIARQKELLLEINRLRDNFKKDSASRKTTFYLKERLKALDKLWEEFEMNHRTILDANPDKSHDYFTRDIFKSTGLLYEEVKAMINTFGTTDKQELTQNLTQPSTSNQGSNAAELLQQQRTNFRALKRLVDGLTIDDIEEKWEVDDELRNLQTRWTQIDSLHLKIDNLLQGSDENYEQQYLVFERLFKQTKRDLNKRLGAMIHQHQVTPQVEIPKFSGDYAQWPTFLDLFKGAIHENPVLSKAQKMQQLKGKLRGDAERLIQHLNVSSENYDTAWEILTHRYQNEQILFTKQIETFLNQPAVQKQNSSDLRKLHDTTLECILAIRNLGVDTISWDPLLVHLLAKKLDSVTYSDYMEARESPRDLPTFDEFMQFLEAKFTALEPISKKEWNDTASFNKNMQPSYSQREKSDKFHKTASNNYNKTFKSNPVLVKCGICKTNNHAIFQCRKFRNMTSDTKLQAVAKHGICINCLYVHEQNECNSTKRCRQCDGFHNSYLHDAIKGEQKHAPSNAKPQPLRQQNATHVANDDDEILLTTVQVRVKSVDGTYVTLRALLDQGSQVTLITENAAQRLGLPRQHCNALISGVTSTTKKGKGKVQLLCKSIHDEYTFTTIALVMNKVINNLPGHSITNKTYAHVQHLQLADPLYNISKPIDILLDANIYSQILMSGLLRGAATEPIAQQTKLGWIVSGRVTQTLNCNVVTNCIEEISSYWEMEDVTTDTNEINKQDQFCEDLYVSTTKRLPDGRYEVRLPMKEQYGKQLGASKPQAVAQFKQLEKKLAKDQQLHDSYHSFMEEYLTLGHMKECVANTNPQCFLPHHGVHKISSTTKLRVVFNASSKTSTGYSLNDLMECGPKLQQDIQGLLLRWREHKYVLTADCEKMYRMVLINELDQQLQKVIWRNNPHEALKEYQLCTITYGMKAAPFLAIRTLQQLAKDDRAKYPLAAQILENDFYVDDLLTGCNTIEQAQNVQQELIQMLQGGGFNLRKWSSNSQKLLQDLSEDQLSPTTMDFKRTDSTKALGLRWNATSDSFTFQYDADSADMTKPLTKRSLLSQISKVFDPLGWLAPIAIKNKLLFQTVWASGIDWDDTVNQNIQQEWSLIREDLNNLDKFKIPRWIGDTQKPCEIHGFCDSSEKNYACVAYLKSKDEHGNTTVKLIAAKTKLAPLKKPITLPRLELCGALLLTKLLTKIKQALQYTDIPMYGWCDSMVVLGWLRGEPTRWKTFVANRVKEITDTLPSSHWKYVKTTENPADCATRGLTPSQLAEHPLWWEGPAWLEQDIEHTSIHIDSPQTEVKSVYKSNAVQMTFPMLDNMLNKHSSITRAVRVLCWVSRFISNARKDAKATRTTYLSSEEIDASYDIITRAVQSQHYENDISRIQRKENISKKSCLLQLNPFLDEKGILRVGGRLQNTNLTYMNKHPIILPHDTRLTELLVDQAHKATLHGGPKLTLGFLRNRWWIISGSRTVKKHIRRCVKCRRFDNSKQNQLMSNLPEPRITPSRPFTHTGVDFTGQVELKLNKGRGVRTIKGYIAVFVCMATKAIHLELVSDLSSSAFLAAFKRMCARRGTPKHMYSDNGTNFIGGAKTLKQEYAHALQLYIDNSFLNDIAEMGVRWHFNAPAWPSGNGLCEAGVRSMKHHLKRVLGDQKLTFEEFTTLLTQIEACLNSRPLYALTEDIEDDILTPGHFLVGGPILSSPFADININCIKTRWHLITQMHRDFWKKWSQEYLHHLQTRTKWHQPKKNMAVNDIVLIKEDNMPPSKWALGKITELHPGKDGYVRVVTVKTKGGTLMKRPIIKLVFLPVQPEPQPTDVQAPNNDNPSTPPQQPPRARRSRRQKQNLLVSVLLMFLTMITPSVQQDFHLTAINSSNTLYFDKVADLGIIQDHWKMVVYYNMTTYWQSITDITNYVQQLSSLCQMEPTFATVATQFEHELKELQHYNNLLTNPTPTRKRRGLINGIGYVANSLFGVLDDRFAQKYEQDIAAIGRKENHLLNLFKNQTSVLEAENNILQRNEMLMNKQFSIINQHLKNISEEVDRANRINENIMKAFYVISSTITVDVVISNLRRIQETLIDTVTNIYHGRLDLHLLSPNQIQEQLNIISGQLQGDLMVPVKDIKDLYSLLHIQARVTKKFLIMEIRIPLLNHDYFELDGVITIPQKKGESAIYTTAQTKYVAINVRKDTLLPITENHLQSCIKQSDTKLLCPLNSPVYNIKAHDSICDTRVSINDKNTKFCQTETKQCADKWVKLHTRDSWLYACCEECLVRILCPAGITSKRLSGTGIIALGQGCVVKGDTFTIHAHYDFINQMFLQQKAEPATPPFESPLNNIINTSLSKDLINSESHAQLYHDIKQKLEILKSQSSQFPSDDVPHYVINYSISSIMALVILLFTIYKVKQRCQLKSRTHQTREEAPIEMTHRLRHAVSECSELHEVVQKSNPKVASSVQCCEFNKSVPNLILNPVTFD